MRTRHGTLYSEQVRAGPSEWVDAQQRAAHHPNFEVPPPEILAQVGPGTLVKIANSRERFWTVVLARAGDSILAMVDNVLLDPSAYDAGDVVELCTRNIYNVRPGSEA